MKTNQISNTITETIVWRGICMEITHVTGCFSSMDHIEIHTEDKLPIPITETGYKSHFFPTGGLGEFETVVDYVRAWLEHEAESKAWKAQEFASWQLSLF